jgi:hypothetical protein
MIGGLGEAFSSRTASLSGCVSRQASRIVRTAAGGRASCLPRGGQGRKSHGIFELVYAVSSLPEAKIRDSAKMDLYNVSNIARTRESSEYAT